MKFLQIIIFLSFGFIYSQQNMGYVRYKINVFSELPEMKDAVEILDGSKMELFFKGDSIHFDIDMGDMMKVKTTEIDQDHILVLLEAMTGKKGVITTRAMVNKTLDRPKSKIKFIPEEEITKTIKGIVCKKAEILIEDSSNPLIFWYTENYEIPQMTYINHFGDIPGLVLSFETKRGDMRLLFEAREINDTPNFSNKFDMSIPEDYENVSLKEVIDMGIFNHH